MSDARIDEVSRSDRESHSAGTAAERLARLEAHFHTVLELELDARDAYVRDVAAIDCNLATELAGLLRAHDSDAVLDSPLLTGPGVLLAGTEVVGAYHLVGIRGAGASGVVYEAKRAGSDVPVALKILHLESTEGSSTCGPIGIERELESLSRVMDPSIARVLDHGVFADGRPYIATELARGITLAAWARSHAPSLATRTRVISRVARAVHAAHEAGVVHRDLKPSNILVLDRQDRECDPEVKVIDFGIARLLPREDVAASPTLGGTGRLLGTLAYMSPEQTRDARTVDARSDIYSLGVVLHELLTGSLPYRVDDVPIDVAVDRIRREIGKPLDHFDASVPRPLSDIVRQAIEKDSARRYATAAEFADDLDRQRIGEPVRARTPSLPDRAVRFVSLHPRLVASIAAVATLVLATTLVVVLAGERARIERQRADAIGATEARIRSLLLGAIGAVGERWASSHIVTLREFADSAAARLDEIYPAIDPIEDERVGMQQVFGSMYLALGVLERAEPLLAAVYDARRARLGPDHPDTIDALDKLARARMLRGDHRFGRESFERIAAWCRGKKGEELRLVNTLRAQFGILIQNGDVDAASRCVDEVFVRSGDPSVAGSDSILFSHIDAALIDRMRGDLGSAEKRLRTAEESFIARYSDHHKGVAQCELELGNLAIARSRFEEALDHFSRAHKISLETNGGSDPMTGSLLALIAQSESALGRCSDAERDFDEGARVLRATFGNDDPNVASIEMQLGALCLAKGDIEPAGRHVDAAITSFTAIQGENGALLVEALEVKAQIVAPSDAGEAKRLLERAESIAQAHPEKALSLSRIRLRRGVLELASGDPASGIAWLERSLAVNVPDVREADELRVATLTILGKTDLDSGRRETAASRFHEALTIAAAKGLTDKEKVLSSLLASLPRPEGTEKTKKSPENP